MTRIAKDKPTSIADLCSDITMGAKWYCVLTNLDDKSELCTRVLHDLKNALGSHLD